MEPIIATELLLSLIDSNETNQLLEVFSVCAMNKEKVPKVKNFLAFVNSLNDDEFQKHFHLSRTICNKLIELFANSDFYPTNISGIPPKSPETHVLAFIWITTNKATLQGTSRLFDMATSTLHEIVHRVMKFMLAIVQSTEYYTKDDNVGVPLTDELKVIIQIVDRVLSQRSFRAIRSKKSAKAELTGLPNEFTDSSRSRRIEWTIGCSQFLLDQFVEFYRDLGPNKKFSSKPELWEALSSDLKKKFNFVCTPDQCENHMKSIKRSYATRETKRQSSGDVFVYSPYDDGMNKLKVLEDSVYSKMSAGINKNRRLKSQQQRYKANSKKNCGGDGDHSGPEPQSSDIVEAMYDIYIKTEENAKRRFEKMFNLIQCIYIENSTKNDISEQKRD